MVQYYLYEVKGHYNAKKGEREQCIWVPTRESTLILWFYNPTPQPLGNEVSSCASQNERTYWTDNPSIGHFCMCKQGKNLTILYIVWFPLIYLSVFCSEPISSDKGSIDISDTFSYFILSRKCGMKSIWKLYLSKLVHGWATGPRQLSLCPNAGMVRIGIRHTSCLQFRFECSLLVRPYLPMRNQYHINFRKRKNHWKYYEQVLLLLLRNSKEHKLIKKKLLHGFMLILTIIATSWKILSSNLTKGEIGALWNRFKPSSKIVYWPFQGGTLFVNRYGFFCLVFVMPLCASVYLYLLVTCWERADLLALVRGV